MKKYDNLMQSLRFREDFCEDTMKKAQKQTKKGMPRGLAIAACICLSVVAMLGTALAVPQIRELIFSNRKIEAVEVVTLPQDNGAMIENPLDVVTARYYKLDGRLNAHEGIGSAIPVEKNGKTTIYSIGADGELVQASAPRVIKKEISYGDRTYSLNMKIYAGDEPTVVDGERIFPLMSDHTYVLGKTNNGVKSPLFLDLNTWDIVDPMQNVSFTAPEGAAETRVSAAKESSVLLIEAEMHDDCRKIYLANRETGEVRFAEDAAVGEWFRSGEKIYRYRNRILSTLGEEGEMLPQFGGAECVYDVGSRIAYKIEGENIRLLLLPTGEEIVLKNAASLFRNGIHATPNRSLKKLCITSTVSSDSFDIGVIAIADMETGEMVSLERVPGMDEDMRGWFDEESYMIAGKIENEWYVCLYHIGK